jgi:hypothetical protein
MIAYTIRIRETVTGKEVDYHQSVEEKYADTQRFYFEDGNGCCDCNRKLMFGEAQGIKFVDPETPCGMNHYYIKVTEDVSGRVILDELSDSVPDATGHS